MICPTCKNDMIVVEHKKIELDYCPNCHGVWFDSGELALFLESMKIEKPHEYVGHMLNGTEQKAAESQRKCPICSQKMKKTVVGEKQKIMIDVCRKGDGLWFDGGEVGQLIEQIPEQPFAGKHVHNHISGFLAEVFKAEGPK